MKTETGVMIMKDGKAWGVTYVDGQFTSYGWIDPENAPILDPKYCKKPSDALWNESSAIAEISKGKIVHVTRTTIVEAV